MHAHATPQQIDNPHNPLYALLLAVWGILWAGGFKRLQLVYQHEWDTVCLCPGTVLVLPALRADTRRVRIALSSVRALSSRWTHIQRQRSPARPPSLLQVNYEAPQTDRRDFVQNPATYKRLNKKSSREEFYPDPLLRVAWLIASSVIIRFDVPCPTLYR